MSRINKCVFIGVGIFSFAFLLFSCGGPKKVVIDVSVNVEKPKNISEADYKKLAPVMANVPVKSVARLTDEKGKLISQVEKNLNLSENLLISAKYDFNVDDFSNVLNIQMKSDKLFVFSADVFKGSIESLEEKKYCSEGDVDKVGYDLICKITYRVTPEISQSILSYLEIRDSISKATDDEFCNSYVSSQSKVNSLEPEIRDIALSDLKNIYNSFIRKIRDEISSLSQRVLARDCSQHQRIQAMRKYFCLMESDMRNLEDLDNFCVALSYYEEGLALLSKGRSIQALDKFRQAVKVRPSFADAYISMGDIYKSEKRYEDAADMYKNAIEFSPSNATAYIKLSDSYVLMKKFDEADRVIRRAIDILGERADDSVYYKRAFILHELGRYDEATEPARRAIIIISSKPEVRYDKELQKNLAKYKVLLGDIYSQTGRVEEAVRELKEALEIDPFSDSALLFLARTLSKSEEKSQLKEAKKYYDKLFTLDSDLAKDGKIRYDYALLLEKLGAEEQDLISAYENVIKYDRENPSAYIKLANLYEKKKGYESLAENMYKNAYEKAKTTEEKKKYLLDYISFLSNTAKYDVAKKLAEDFLKTNREDKDVKQKYNELNILTATINPAIMRKLGFSPTDIDSIYSLFSSIPPDTASRIAETVGISKDVFDRLDPYKKLVVVVIYMDILYGTDKSSILQKSEKYNELFGGRIDKKLLPKLSKLVSSSFGIKFMM